LALVISDVLYFYYSTKCEWVDGEAHKQGYRNKVKSKKILPSVKAGTIIPAGNGQVVDIALIHNC